MALRQLMENMSEQQLPDAVQVSNGTAQVGTIVAEDKLNNAILNENAAADPALTASGAGQASAPGTAEGDQAGQQEPGQGQASGQEGAQGQDQAAGQQPVQSSGGEQDSGTSQTSGGGEQPVQGETQTPETKPAAGPTAELESYTIQRGDTLIGICVKRYGSDTRVSEVCSLNNIEDPDDIKVGEKIFLPQ